MNLRESLDNPDHGEGMADPVEGREVYIHASGYVAGYADAAGLRLVFSTDGPTMRIHNLSVDTRSAVIHRAGLTTTRAVITALRAQLDALPYWTPESDTWGPDPWLNDDDPPIRRTPTPEQEPSDG